MSHCFKMNIIYDELGYCKVCATWFLKHFDRGAQECVFGS